MLGERALAPLWVLRLENWWFLAKRRSLFRFVKLAAWSVVLLVVADAAARYYFGKSVGRLTRSEATELAAALSSPVMHNPVTRTRYFERQLRKITRNMRWWRERAAANNPQSLRHHDR